MENAGAVTFLEDYVFGPVTRYSYERRAETVLHEMAHMWFGDLVTMRWWDDLWLNEVLFATFASVLCQAEATESRHRLDHVRERREVLGVPAGPVAVDASGCRRDSRSARRRGELRRITYAKGASVPQATGGLRRLDAFLSGLRDYSATTPSTTPPSGICWAPWRIVRARPVALGPPVAQDHRAEHAAAGLRRRQRRQVHPIRHRAGRAALAPGRPGCTGWPSASTTTTAASWCACTGGTRRRWSDDGCSCPAGVSRGKLILVNDDDLTYCSLRLDPASLRDPADPDRRHRRLAPRTLAWSAAWR